jgi:hypothetical protein
LPEVTEKNHGNIRLVCVLTRFETKTLTEYKSRGLPNHKVSSIVVPAVQFHRCSCTSVLKCLLEKLTENDLTVPGTSNIPAQKTFMVSRKKNVCFTSKNWGEKINPKTITHLPFTP